MRFEAREKRNTGPLAWKSREVHMSRDAKDLDLLREAVLSEAGRKQGPQSSNFKK